MRVPRLSMFSTTALLGIAVLASTAAPAAAQDKIAYASLDVIVSLMLETKAMAQEIDALGRKLAKDLDTKEQFAEQKAKEARDAAGAGASEADLEKRRTELRGLQENLRKGAEDADAELAKKRMELLKPVFEKLEKTIPERFGFDPRLK